MLLQPRGGQPRCGPKQEEWRQGPNVIPPQSPAFPPRNQKHGGRQRTRNAFAQQGGREQDQRQKIATPAPPFRSARPFLCSKAQERQRRPQVKHGGEDILALCYPRHGFHLHWMQCENSRRDPGSGQFQPAQQAIKQQSGKGMKSQIDGMITEGMKPPKMILQPKGGVDQRIVLRRGGRIEPDAPQTGQTAQGLVAGHIAVIVPDKPAAQEPACRPPPAIQIAPKRPNLRFG